VRILLICEAFGSIGGVQEVVDNLAAELSAAGQQVAIVSSPESGARTRTIRFGGECRYMEIPSRRPLTLRHLERLWPQSVSSQMRQFSAAIAALRPDVVSSHCWSWDRFPAVAAGCRRAGVALVHSLFDSWGRGKMGAAALRSLRGAAAIVALSEATRRFFEPILPGARAARVITGGVDPGGPQSAGARLHPRPYIFCAARLDRRHKAIDALIAGFALIARGASEVDLLIGGDGPDRGALEALANAAGVGNRVRFTGAVSRSELWTLYQHALLFAMPSRMPEGLGLVFLESMACGVPVIGTRSGGTTEIVDDGGTGILIDNNSPQELASAMRRMLDDPAARAAMGQRARAAVLSRFTWNRFAQQYLEVYSSCTRGNRELESSIEP